MSSPSPETRAPARACWKQSSAASACAAPVPARGCSASSSARRSASAQRAEMTRRLPALLDTIYLLFTGGYTAGEGRTPLAPQPLRDLEGGGPVAGLALWAPQAP